MEKTTVVAIVLAPILGPLIGYALFLPGRLIARWAWRTLPDGKLRDALLKKRGEDKETWPKLPPAP